MRLAVGSLIGEAQPGTMQDFKILEKGFKTDHERLLLRNEVRRIEYPEEENEKNAQIDKFLSKGKQTKEYVQGIFCEYGIEGRTKLAAELGKRGAVDKEPLEKFLRRRTDICKRNSGSPRRMCRRRGLVFFGSGRLPIKHWGGPTWIGCAT